MWFCNIFLRAYTGTIMKKYVNILTGVVVLLLVLYAGQLLVQAPPQANVSDVEAKVGEVSVSGQVVRSFEGDNVIEYNFDIPETATTTTEMDGALIRVTNETSPLATIYLSYEGARGYTPMDYINNIVAPHVSVINPTEITRIGNYDWQGAESEGSEWHVASVMNGKWLVVIESKKSVHDSVERTIESFGIN